MVLKDEDEEHEYDEKVGGGEDDVDGALEHDEMFDVEIIALLEHGGAGGEVSRQGEWEL